MIFLKAYDRRYLSITLTSNITFASILCRINAVRKWKVITEYQISKLKDVSSQEKFTALIWNLITVLIFLRCVLLEVLTEGLYERLENYQRSFDNDWKDMAEIRKRRKKNNRHKNQVFLIFSEEYPTRVRKSWEQKVVTRMKFLFHSFDCFEIRRGLYVEIKEIRSCIVLVELKANCIIGYSCSKFCW